MSYEQRKINRQKREKRHKTFIASIGITLFIIIISSLIGKKSKTIFAVEDVFLQEIELESVVIKDEKVFILDNTKEIDISKLEGKKISAGTKVGNATVLKDLNALKKELTEVEKAISTLEKTSKDEVFQNDKKKLTEDYNKNIQRLQDDIYNNNYANINNLKEQVTLIDKDIDDLLPQNTLLGQSVESLNNKKEELKKAINQKDSSYISETSGIVSYEVDGYENILKPQVFENYTYDKLPISDETIKDTGKKKKDTKANNDVKGFKIIENFEWHLALKIDDRKKIQKYEIGDTLLIKYPLGDKFIEMNGEIVSINNSSNKSVIVLKFNKYLHDLYKDRFPKVKLVQEKLEALKIPSNSIIEQDGKTGVYIKDFSGIVRFRPVKVIDTVGNYAYVDKGKDSIIIIDSKSSEARTISIYDEIFLKPNRFKEGEIIN